MSEDRSLTPDETDLVGALAELHPAPLASAGMKQFLLGAIMYANNKGVAGADIEAVMQDQRMSRAILRDPLHPNEAIGYVYIPADFLSKDAGKIPVLYQKWGGGKLVGFADGHVESLESRTAVENLIKTRQSK